MERSDFINAFTGTFLAAVAAQRYLNNNDPTWKWVKTQPVEDAKYIAEKAWDSLEELAPPFTNVTDGSAVTATTETASIPTTSSTPESVDQTLSQTF